MTQPKSALPPLKQPTTGTGTPFAGLPRFGVRATGEIVPVETHYLLFDLRQIGSGLYEWIGMDSPDAPEDIATLMIELARNKELAREVRGRLDQAWTLLDLHGAMLVRDWQDSMRLHLSQSFDLDRQRELETPWSLTKEHPSLCAVIDPAIALNVLSRSRHALLMATAPAAFDSAILGRRLLTSDSRLFDLVTNMDGHSVYSLVTFTDSKPDAVEEPEK